MSKIRSTFNGAASNYDDNAFLQNEIANRLAEKLKVISIKPQTIIDLGSGTGLLSNKTAEIFPNAKIIHIYRKYIKKTCIKSQNFR